MANMLDLAQLRTRKLSPQFSQLESMRKMGGKNISFAEGMNHNPLLFKYVWRVFHSESPVDGVAFAESDYICTAEAMALIRELSVKGEPCIIYNKCMPRTPVNGSPPWDVHAKRWEHATWAPNFAEDTDPLWNGFK